MSTAHLKKALADLSIILTNWHAKGGDPDAHPLIRVFVDAERHGTDMLELMKEIMK